MNLIWFFVGIKLICQDKYQQMKGNYWHKKKIYFFFETSAKSGDGVHNMMFTCIAKLPFFEQFKIDNNDKLIKDLIEGNGSVMNDAKKSTNNANVNQNIIDESSSNYALTKDKKINNNIEEEKKKCGC